jgi:peroxiredoxin
LGYQIIAVSPDLPENTREMDDKFKPGFPLLCDPKMDATHAFGLAWKVSDRDAEYYEKLRRASGETHQLLPVPAVLIVSREGVIKFEYINPNYKVRPPIELILAAAEAVNKLEAEAE